MTICRGESAQAHRHEQRKLHKACTATQSGPPPRVSIRLRLVAARMLVVSAPRIIPIPIPFPVSVSVSVSVSVVAPVRRGGAVSPPVAPITAVIIIIAVMSTVFAVVFVVAAAGATRLRRSVVVLSARGRGGSSHSRRTHLIQRALGALRIFLLANPPYAAKGTRQQAAQGGRLASRRWDAHIAQSIKSVHHTIITPKTWMMSVTMSACGSHVTHISLTIYARFVFVLC